MDSDWKQGNQWGQIPSGFPWGAAQLSYKNLPRSDVNVLSAASSFSGCECSKVLVVCVGARPAAHPGGRCCIPSSPFHGRAEHSVLHLALPRLVRIASLLKCFSFSFDSFHQSLQRSCFCCGVKARGWVIFVFEQWQLGACGSISFGGNLIFSVRGWKIIQNLLRTAVVWAHEYNVIHWLYCKKSLLKMKMGNQFVVSILSCSGMEQWLIWKRLSSERAKKAVVLVIIGVFYNCSVI